MESKRNLFKAHPWHGIAIGEECPRKVTSYIEIIPTDVVKYEIDKESGYLRIDRPQKYSNHCPTLYGFIPQTYCGDGIGSYSAEQAQRPSLHGDGDALDICVLTEKSIQHGDILVKAVPIGGLRMIDKDEADDKIIAILDQDGVYSGITDIEQCPKSIVDSLRHYFLTYKELPGSTPRKIEITDVYGADTARKVIQLAQEDYRKKFQL